MDLIIFTYLNYTNQQLSFQKTAKMCVSFLCFNISRMFGHLEMNKNINTNTKQVDFDLFLSSVPL